MDAGWILVPKFERIEIPSPGVSFDPNIDSFMEQNFKLVYRHPAVRDAVRAVLCRPDWLVKCLSDVDPFRCC